MKLYTKNGDDGGTGLLFGKKVSKADSRTEAYGSLDSAIKYSISTFKRYRIRAYSEKYSDNSFTLFL